VPNIDAFNLTTGSLDTTLINSSPDTVYVGNDVDSMYGLRSYLRSTGEYVVMKDNYNGSSIVVYRCTPCSPVPAAAPSPALDQLSRHLIFMDMARWRSIQSE
jgi:hypothetical protein